MDAEPLIKVTDLIKEKIIQNCLHDFQKTDRETNSYLLINAVFLLCTLIILTIRMKLIFMWFLFWFWLG